MYGFCFNNKTLHFNHPEHLLLSFNESLTLNLLVQDLTSAVSSFGSHLPRFIKTITSLQSVGVPDSIPVS